MAPIKTDIEKEKLEFEKEKFHKQLAFNEKELEIKTRKLDIKEKEILKTKDKMTPAQVTIIAALLGIFTTLIATYIQNNGNQQLEKTKFESEMILKVASSNDLEQNKKNLKFLIDVGLISDNINKIHKVIKDTSSNLKIVENVPTAANIIIQGHVINPNHMPLGGVLVKARFASHIIETFTDNGGQFLFYIGSNSIGRPTNFTFERKGFKSYNRDFILRPNENLQIILNGSRDQ